MRTPSIQTPAVAEPFGQGGIRRLIYPALTNSLLLLSFLSLAMWARSYYVREWADCIHSNTRWYVASVYGRLLIAKERSTRIDEPWSYSQEPMHRITTDAWEDSWWKRIGIQTGRGGLPSGRTNPPFYGREQWLRIRWPFLAVVSMILPVVRLIQERRQRGRASSARSGLTDGVCPHCGVSVARFVNPCPSCGATL